MYLNCAEDQLFSHPEADVNAGLPGVDIIDLGAIAPKNRVF